MTDLPDVKLKMLVSFPAAVHGGTGLAVVQQNGIFTFNLDYTQFPMLPSIPPPNDASNYVLAYNAVTQSFSLVPVTWLRS